METVKILGLVFSLVTPVLLFLLGIIVKNLFGRIADLERDKVNTGECLLKHQLDKERIENLDQSIKDIDKRNSTDHQDLKEGMGDIYTVLDKVKECVYKLAGRVDKPEEEPAT